MVGHLQTTASRPHLQCLPTTGRGLLDCSKASSVPTVQCARSSLKPPPRFTVWVSRTPAAMEERTRPVRSLIGLDSSTRPPLAPFDPHIPSGSRARGRSPGILLHPRARPRTLPHLRLPATSGSTSVRYPGRSRRIRPAGVPAVDLPRATGWLLAAMPSPRAVLATEQMHAGRAEPERS
jgi:hypothetical protein